jgi:hypothetical protein
MAKNSAVLWHYSAPINFHQACVIGLKVGFALWKKGILRGTIASITNDRWLRDSQMRFLPAKNSQLGENSPR